MDPGQFTPFLGVSDPIAAGTHFLGALASIAATVTLWRRTAGDRWRRFTVAVFGASMLLLFTASTAYHTAFPGPLKVHLRRYDHAAIYVLIAGTYTPIVGNLVRGWLRAFVLGTVWSCALAGVVLKLFFFGVAPEWLDTTLYLAMGWFGVVPFVRIFQDHGACRPVALVGLPAVFYSIGALCELYGWPVVIEHVFGHHEVFHLCVLGASALFYVFVLEYVAPRARPRAGDGRPDPLQEPVPRPVTGPLEAPPAPSAEPGPAETRAIPKT